ncbi:hypothetical protein G7Y79_00007g022850 [Physcia stellaris]|nr:hypothetical protein G7Y79_00007g022850 [Physcia stellaris]
MFKKMPWSSHEEGQKHSAEEEESLTSILDENQRGELTLFIASITAAMRKTIESNFDASAGPAPKSDPPKDLRSEDEKIMNPDVDPATSDVAQLDKERKFREQQRKELSNEKTQEMKKESLKFIDQWRLHVIQRVGSIVNSKEEASSHLQQASAPDNTVHSPSDTKINPSPSDPTKSIKSAAEDKLSSLFPPIATPLADMDEPKKILILHSTLLLLLSLEHYTALSRVLLLYMTSSFHLPLKTLTEDEEKVAKGLLEAAKQMSGDTETQKKADENKTSRKWKVGLASVAGAAVIGVTGGLAAPLVAAGVGSVMGGLGLGATAAAGYLGSVAGSTLIVGGLFGAYGGKMTGEMMDNYAREVSDFAFLPIPEGLKDLDAKASETSKKQLTEGEKHHGDHSKPTAISNPLSQPEDDVLHHPGGRKSLDGKPLKGAEKAAVDDPSSRRLRVTIGISGWLTSKPEILTPWRVLGSGSENFALRWELEALLNLGNSMTTMVSSAAWGYAKSEVIKHTVFAQLSMALWPLALLKVSRVVDNPFSVAKIRADKAGEVLADALINKAQGERPVTLVGYSLGARVIYSCLMSLAKRRAFGLVESVVLMGAPAPASTSDWREIRSVVAGRVVNVFSANDYVLGFLYRTSSVQLGVAGLQKIEGLPGVENVDVSETVSGHLRYRYLVGAILAQIGFEDLDLEQVEKERETLKKMDEEEEHRKLLDQAYSAGEKVVYGADGKPKTVKKSDEEKAQDEKKAEEEAHKMEEEVRQKTEQGLLSKYTPGLPSKFPNMGEMKSSLPFMGGKGDAGRAEERAEMK